MNPLNEVKHLQTLEGNNYKSGYRVSRNTDLQNSSFLQANFLFFLTLAERPE